MPRRSRTVELRVTPAQLDALISPRAVVALCPECKGRGELALHTTTIAITAKCAACNGKAGRT